MGTCERVREYPSAVGVPNVLMLSPDGRYLAMNGEHGQDIVLHDAAAMEALSVLAVRAEFQVGAAAFSPNSRFLVASAEKKSSKRGQTTSGEDDDIDHGILVWDVVAGEFLRELRGHTRRVRAMAFSPNSDLLVAVATDETIRMWDVATGKLQKFIKRHDVGVTAVAFSPNGLMLATAGTDRVLRLWNTAKGKIIREIDPPDGMHYHWKHLAFSPDGRFLAAHDKETIHLFDPAAGKLLVPANKIITDTRDMVPLDGIHWWADSRVLHSVIGGVSLEYMLPDQADPGTPAKGLFVDSGWIVKGTEKVLLLPFEYRPACVVAKDGLLVVATFYGRLLIFKFD